MQTLIDNAIEQINQGAEWILKNAKVDKKKSYKALVKERRTLKKIKNACIGKPSIALYGQSQCGKSHLASSLLSVDINPLLVIDRMNHVNHEFLTHLNPQGKNEATGLITRFTTELQTGITEKYPVHITLMSVKDIALMLCDGYYRDINQHAPFVEDDVKQLIEDLKSRKTSIRQQYICEDDIGEIEEYFHNFSPALYYALSKDAADYFGELSIIIEYLSEKDVILALNMFWNNDPNISTKFRMMFDVCKELDFSRDAYISFEDLDNSKENNQTFLHVSWLDFDHTEVNAQVRFKNYVGDYAEKTVCKAILAAICSEVILEVVPPPETINEKSGYINKILKNMDILDFPGARSRGGIIATKGQEPQLIRRGKVGYYFNRYSSERRINSLMFCWEPNIFEAKPMETTLRNWVDISIGRTPEERSEFLKDLEVPPFFFVGTKFNLLLDSTTADRDGNNNAFLERWKNWFVGQLSTEIIGMPGVGGDKSTDNHKWFEEWTKEESCFNNCYLLRDFRYSTSIFEGWKETGKENTIRKNEPYTGFYVKLRDSFINNPFVKKHFRDAVSRWDEASEANCDGSLPIARNLASIVEKIANTAAAKNLRDINESIFNVIAELKKHYYNTDTEESLKKALNAAARLQASLDNAFARDPYYFGHFMKSVTITEYAVHEVFADVFPTVANAGNVGDYVYIYMRAPDIKPTNSFDDNMRILRAAYGFTNEEECRQYFENNLGINLEELFRRSEFGLQSPSRVLAATLKTYWFEKWLKGSQRDRLCTMLGEESFEEMVNMFYSLFVKYEMERRVAQTIHNYVDTFGVNVQQISEMIADICSEMINKFVLTVGYDYYSVEDGVVDNLKEASLKHQIGLNFGFIDEERQPANNNHIAAIMSQMDDMERTRQMLISPSSHSIDELSAVIPGFRQSRRWSDLAKIGFVLTNDIPHYDVEANVLLGSIIEECRTLNK